MNKFLSALSFVLLIWGFYLVITRAEFAAGCYYTLLSLIIRIQLRNTEAE